MKGKAWAWTRICFTPCATRRGPCTGVQANEGGGGWRVVPSVAGHRLGGGARASVRGGT